MDASEALRRAARRWPDREALRCGDVRVTFGDLERRVNRLARLLVRRGVRSGDRVATWLPNGIAQVAAQQAILRAGAIWVAINRRLAPPEAAFMLAHAGARALLVDAAPPAGVDAPALAVVLDVGGADAVVEAALAAEDEGAPTVTIAGDAVARLRYTSGTTGRPKAAVLTHASAVASLRTLLGELHDLGPDDVVAHVAPLTHASEALLAPAFWRGARAVIVPHFEAGAFCELVARERVTTTFLVPTMFADVTAATAGTRPGALASLRSVLYGAAPIGEALLAAALERFGPVLLQIYGLSECPFPITTLRKDDHLDARLRRTCGLPTPGSEVRVVDAAGGPGAPGAVGTIAVRGPQLMREYWEDPAATAAALRDGWLHTGDLGVLDDAGFLTLVDRSDDVIISGGFNVYPREVEVVLEAHPAVAEAGVAAVPHARWGQGVAAWVVCRPGATVDEAALIAFCRERLAGYKKPVRVTLVPALPKTPTGKLLRRALRDD